MPSPKHIIVEVGDLFVHDLELWSLLITRVERFKETYLKMNMITGCIIVKNDGVIEIRVGIALCDIHEHWSRIIECKSPTEDGTVSK